MFRGVWSSHKLTKRVCVFLFIPFVFWQTKNSSVRLVSTSKHLPSPRPHRVHHSHGFWNPVPLVILARLPNIEGSCRSQWCSYFANTGHLDKGADGFVSKKSLDFTRSSSMGGLPAINRLGARTSVWRNSLVPLMDAQPFFCSWIFLSISSHHFCSSDSYKETPFWPRNNRVPAIGSFTFIQKATGERNPQTSPDQKAAVNGGENGHVQSYPSHEWL